MTSLFETIQRIVQDELRQIRTAELGVVQNQHAHAGASDKDNYACTVALRDSGIVLKNVPVATGKTGTASIPAVGDLVLVQFIGGDVNAPIITGSFYNDQDRPPVNDDGQMIAHLPLGAGDSDAVHVELSSNGKREITIKLGQGLSIMLKDDDPAVEVSVGSSPSALKIDKDGTITISSPGKISLKGNEISIEADSTLTLKGNSAVNIN